MRVKSGRTRFGRFDPDGDRSAHGSEQLGVERIGQRDVRAGMEGVELEDGPWNELAPEAERPPYAAAGLHLGPYG